MDDALDLMITRTLHLDCKRGSNWMLPILVAANVATVRGAVGPLPASLGELSLHLTTRLGILSRIQQRLSRNTLSLYDQAKSHKPEHVFTPEREGMAFTADSDLVYELLADIDAILFELNASTEQMKRVFEAVHDHVGRPLPPGGSGRRIQDILLAQTQKIDWFQKLDRHRNLFIHESTPYIAIDISSEPWDLLIMKKNLKTFSEPEDFLRLGEIAEIIRGFGEAAPVVQSYLVSLYTP